MCEFDETSFPKVSDDDGKPRAQFDFEQPETKEIHKDPYNGQGEKDVRRILHLHRIAQNAPDVFAASERVTRSELNEATNYPASVAVDSVPATTVTPPNSKRGRPKGAKDLVPRKRRSKAELTGDSVVDETTTKVGALTDPLAEVNVSAFLALHDDESEPQTIRDCKSSPDWPM
jgi:hypothetical protein